MSRIDDAVRRILRVKLRAGMFDGIAPSAHAGAGQLAGVQHRELARRAVRESLVLLLKNERAALPIRRGTRVLVVGKTANSVPNQSGGWSLTWQGDETSDADYPDADTILAGIEAAAGKDNVVFVEKPDGVDPASFDVAIAVIGETPYAETKGDLAPPKTLTHAQRYPEDLAALLALSAAGKPVVAVFVSGRPVYANDL